ncbi:MAG: diguanylate cyclase [Sulfuritalea sp.]|nr:diguanylate cyclase [Sulfuritalea sp.]
MMILRLGIRGRLMLSAVLPAVSMVLILAAAFLNHFDESMERSFEERSLAIARQIGAASEYALFSGSIESLHRVAEGTRQADPAIMAVSVLDRHGRTIVHSGVAPRRALPPSDSVQIHKGEEAMTLQMPIVKAALLLKDERDVWHAGRGDLRPPAASGHVRVEISRAELSTRKREMIQVTLAIMLGGMLLTGWLALRMAGKVLPSLDKTQRELRRQKEYAELLARTDALTGLANRRAFDEAAEQEVQRALRYNTPLALVLADIDRFKGINDRHGHDVGDRFLQHFAQILSHSVRTIDLVGRWGGEEFAVLMPGTDLEEAARAAERMRQAVRLAEPPLGEPDCGYTVSFGVAAFRTETPTMASLLGRADAALYRAKADGRDRVERG